MKLTVRVKYALYAISYLQKVNGERRVSAQELCGENKLSSGVMSQVLRDLKIANLVESKKGPGGGYVFTKDLAQIPIKELFSSVGSDFFLHQDAEMICEKAETNLKSYIEKFANEPLNLFV